MPVFRYVLECAHVYLFFFRERIGCDAPPPEKHSRQINEVGGKNALQAYFPRWQNTEYTSSLSLSLPPMWVLKRDPAIPACLHTYWFCGRSVGGHEDGFLQRGRRVAFESGGGRKAVYEGGNE